MTALDTVLAHADQNLDSSLEKMFALCRIKSISTDMAYKSDCRAAAQWLVDDRVKLGFEASVRDTAGHPMVVGHHSGARADAPHVLIYPGLSMEHVSCTLAGAAARAGPVRIMGPSGVQRAPDR